MNHKKVLLALCEDKYTMKDFEENCPTCLLFLVEGKELPILITLKGEFWSENKLGSYERA